MKSYLWGPYYWYFFHALTFTYEKDKKEIYKNFFYNIKNILPCPVCRLHYSKYIEKYKPDDYLNSKKEMIDWLYRFHNRVNKGLRKKQFNYKNLSINSIDLNMLLKMIDIMLSDKINNNIENYKLFFKQIIYIFPNKKLRKELLLFLKIKINKFNDLKLWYNSLKTKLLINSYLIKIDELIIDCYKFKKTKYYYTICY